MALLKEEVLGFPSIMSWDPTRYVPGTSFKPHMIVYQIIAEVYADPMEHISWRPVELVSTHQAHCSPRRNVIYEAVQPLWELTQNHFGNLVSQRKKVCNMYLLSSAGFVHTTHRLRAVVVNVSKLSGRGR